MVTSVRRATGRSPTVQGVCHAQTEDDSPPTRCTCVARGVRPLASPAARRTEVTRNSIPTHARHADSTRVPGFAFAAGSRGW